MYLSLATLMPIIKTDLTYPDGTDLNRPYLHGYFPTGIHDWLSQLFWIYLFILTPVFVLQWLCLHLETLIMMLSVSIDFPSNSKGHTAFQWTVYNYSCADWGDLTVFYDHLRDFPWDHTFKLGGPAAATEFYEWDHVGINVYMPHHKYQVKSHSSPRFSAACCYSHRNHFFHLYH